MIVSFFVAAFGVVDVAQHLRSVVVVWQQLGQHKNVVHTIYNMDRRT